MSIISEFLVSLGYKIDSSSEGEFLRSTDATAAAAEQSAQRIDKAEELIGTAAERAAKRYSEAWEKNRILYTKAEQDAILAEEKAKDKAAADEKKRREKETKDAEKARRDDIRAQERQERDEERILQSRVRNAVIQGELIARALMKTAEGFAHSVSNAVTNLDELYFASKRTGASAENLDALRYAFTQVGGSAGEATAAVDGLAKALRTNPQGVEGYLHSIGVKTRDSVTGNMLDTTKILEQIPKRLAATYKIYGAQAIASAQILGIPEETLNKYRIFGDELAQEQERFKQKTRAFGLSESEATNNAHALMTEWRDLGATIHIVGEMIGGSGSGSLIGVMKSFDDWLVGHGPEINQAITNVASAFADVSKSTIDFFSKMTPKQWDGVKEGAEHFRADLILVKDAVVAVSGAILNLLGYSKDQSGTKELVPSTWNTQLSDTTANVTHLTDALNGLRSVVAFLATMALPPLLKWPAMAAAVPTAIDEAHMQAARKFGESPQGQALPEVNQQSWGQWLRNTFGGGGEKSPIDQVKPNEPLPANPLGRLGKGPLVNPTSTPNAVDMAAAPAPVRGSDAPQITVQAAPAPPARPAPEAPKPLVAGPAPAPTIIAPPTPAARAAPVEAGAAAAPAPATPKRGWFDWLLGSKAPEAPTPSKDAAPAAAPPPPVKPAEPAPVVLAPPVAPVKRDDGLFHKSALVLGGSKREENTPTAPLPPAPTIGGDLTVEIGRDTRSWLERLFDRISGNDPDPSIQASKFGGIGGGLFAGAGGAGLIAGGGSSGKGEKPAGEAPSGPAQAPPDTRNLWQRYAPTFLGGKPAPEQPAATPDPRSTWQKIAPKFLGGQDAPAQPAPPADPRNAWQRTMPTWLGGKETPAAGGPGAPGTYRPEYKLSAADLDPRVVNTVAGEALHGNQSSIDAVIHNMLNRVGSKGWGPSANLLQVARAPGQYAGYSEADPKYAEFIRARIKAIASGSEPDPTHGANTYRAAWYGTRGGSPWFDRIGRSGTVIGGNRFAKDPSVANGPYGSYEQPKAATNRLADQPPPNAAGVGAKASDLAQGLTGANAATASKALGSFMHMGEWCADFVNASLKSAGGKGSGSSIATSFLNWGKAVGDAADVQKGDVLVQGRGHRAGETGGHVGIATGNVRRDKDGNVTGVEMTAGNTGNRVQTYMEDPRKLTIRRGDEDPKDRMVDPSAKDDPRSRFMLEPTAKSTDRPSPPVEEPPGKMGDPQVQLDMQGLYKAASGVIDQIMPRFAPAAQAVGRAMEAPFQAMTAPFAFSAPPPGVTDNSVTHNTTIHNTLNQNVNASVEGGSKVDADMFADSMTRRGADMLRNLQAAAQ